MKEVKYYHKNSDVVAFEREEFSSGSWGEKTYDENGNELTYKNSNGFWRERTYDKTGNELTYKSSEGYWSETTYDKNGNVLIYKTSDGYWSETTYDENGNELTYKESDDIYRIKDEWVTKSEFEAFTSNQSRPCVGKKVVVDGIEYELK